MQRFTNYINEIKNIFSPFIKGEKMSFSPFIKGEKMSFSPFIKGGLRGILFSSKIKEITKVEKNKSFSSFFNGKNKSFSPFIKGGLRGILFFSKIRSSYKSYELIYRWILSICLFLAVILLSSCTSSIRFSGDRGGSISKSSGHTSKSSKTGSKDINTSGLTKKQTKILEEAERWIGTPYCWGGESMDCADCSGFVMEVFSKNGIQLPRTAEQQYEFGKKVSIDNAKPGDLIFFSKGNKITHVGIYIGDRTFIHASSSNGVIIQDLDTFGNSPAYAGCREVF